MAIEAYICPSKMDETNPSSKKMVNTFNIFTNMYIFRFKMNRV